MDNFPIDDKFQEDDSFEGVIERIKAYMGVKHDLDVAQLLNLSKTAFAERKRRGSIPDDKIALLCRRESINMNWMLTGIGWSYKPENPKDAYEWIKKQFEKSVPVYTIVIVKYEGEGGGYQNGFLLLRKDIPAVVSMEGRHTRTGYRGAGPLFYAEILRLIYTKRTVKVGRVNLGPVEPVYFEDVNFVSLYTSEGKVKFDISVIEKELKALGESIEPELIKKRGLDPELMKEVIEAIEEIFQKEKLSLSPKKKTELIMLIYEEVSEGRSEISSLHGRVLKLVKLAS